MSSGLPSGNAFESISLGPTADKAFNRVKPRSMNSRVPESASATSDDDELDPEEFLSQELPRILNKKEIPSMDDLEEVGILNSTTILGDTDTNNRGRIHNNERLSQSTELQSRVANDISSNINRSVLSDLRFLTQSPLDTSISNSIVFPQQSKITTETGNHETLIEYLLNENSSLQQDLYKSILAQKRILGAGDNQIHRVRQSISLGFDKLSESYYLLNEAYTREIRYTESLHQNFKRWDNRREAILGKISKIKSNKNKHGSKLEKLLDESNSIDKEVAELEGRLRTLKKKKQLINAEIDDTSSVLESRTSKYVDTFNSLEKLGKDAIVDFLNLNKIDSPNESIVRFVPVDVTFLKNYSEIQNRNNATSKTNLISSDTTSNTVNTDGKKTDSMEHLESTKKSGTTKNPGYIGMQPLIVPDDAPEILGIQEDLSLANHGHGLTPFEKGFQKGTKLSNNVKGQFNTFLRSFIAAYQNSYDSDVKPNAKPLKQIDDLTNTIANKIDLQPILALLDHRLEDLREFLSFTSKQATIFHEYGITWNEIVSIIQKLENKLLDQFSDSKISKDNIDKNIVLILKSSLDQLRTCVLRIGTHPSLAANSLTTRRNPLFKSIIHEIKAICATLVTASNDDNYLQRINEFKKILGSGKSNEDK